MLHVYSVGGCLECKSDIRSQMRLRKATIDVRGEDRQVQPSGNERGVEALSGNSEPLRCRLGRLSAKTY